MPFTLTAVSDAALDASPYRRAERILAHINACPDQAFDPEDIARALGLKLRIARRFLAYQTRFKTLQRLKGGQYASLSYGAGRPAPAPVTDPVATAPTEPAPRPRGQRKTHDFTLLPRLQAVFEAHPDRVLQYEGLCALLKEYPPRHATVSALNRLHSIGAIQRVTRGAYASLHYRGSAAPLRAPAVPQAALFRESAPGMAPPLAAVSLLQQERAKLAAHLASIDHAIAALTNGKG